MGDLKAGKVPWAAEIARALLADVGSRYPHTLGVARQAQALMLVLPDHEAELLLAAAYLHDVGYAPQLVATGHHAIDGARYLHREGLDVLAGLVAHHTGAAFEAEERGLVDALEEFPCEDGRLVDALTFCDLSTSPRGEPVAPDRRLDEILTRYPPDDPVHRAVSRSRPSLMASVERARGLLGQPM